jgi:hypothetical protein
MKSLGDPEATLEEVAGVFGPYHDKSGWHYRLHTTPEIQSFVRDLYQRVFQRKNILKDTFSLEFA